MQLLGDCDMSAFLRASLTELISVSHEMMRSFAANNILESLQRAEPSKDSTDLKTEAHERALSVVSLRDIQRVFSLFEFFLKDMANEENDVTPSSLQRSSMLLSISLVYYLRLDSQSRDEFISVIDELPTEAGQRDSLVAVLQKSLDDVARHTDIPDGIAVTQGLKENLFTTLICSLSQTPLMIVGPPGSSKVSRTKPTRAFDCSFPLCRLTFRRQTLAVNTVSDNANGTDSIRSFYSGRPRLSFFHYQCSKQSTSKEIAAVFDLATQRQRRLDDEKHRCIVFMDEAGLPEEEKESLKVLHYLLEGHMSTRASVGFVAISNHVLDAAKSNRCVTLLRQSLDKVEMETITVGVLFDVRSDGRASILDVELQGCLIQSREFALLLCQSYEKLLSSKGCGTNFDTWFGLRDYIFFLKALRSKFSRIGGETRMFVSLEDVVWALERNFNGVAREEFHVVLLNFLRPLVQNYQRLLPDRGIESLARHPVDVLRDALRPETISCQIERPRFKLIVDCTDDDSILRLLRAGKLANVTQRSLYKLSSLSENIELEQLRLISGVKFAALQGNFAVLSQTGPVNESFYDLFNLRFQEITGRDGEVSLYTNIAVGGISRRSLVNSDFECVIHTRHADLDELPAPFLNRFEKYRLTLDDVLEKGWSKFGRLGSVILLAQHQVMKIAHILDEGATRFSWVGSPHTIKSIFVDLLPLHGIDGLSDDEERPFASPCFSSMTFLDGIQCILQNGTSMNDIPSLIDSCVENGRRFFQDDRKRLLESVLSRKAISTAEMMELFGPFFSSTKVAGSDRPDIAGTITQMAVTLFVSQRLIQLATPEAIFRNRESLPIDLIQEYFRQEHFSLKHLLARHSRNTSKSSLLMIHTRSDQYIQKIPSLPVDRGTEHEQSGVLDIVRNLVDSKPDRISIEHLERLRSEASLRGAVEAWVKHPEQKIFLLIVDMSRSDSISQVNFIRTLVEQYLDDQRGKHFALLSHYSSSSSLNAHCYPALFLGRWEHVFLDGVRRSNIEQFVELACLGSNAAATRSLPERGIQSVRECTQSLLPRIVANVASRDFFYKTQSIYKTNFRDRKRLLETMLSMKIGEETLANTICKKFESFWLKEALMKTTNSASEGLLNGTTQLPLCMSIHSTLVQSFQKFLNELIVFCNQWENLDVLFGSESNDSCSALFQKILENSPVLPFEELMLRQSYQTGALLCPIPATRPQKSSAVFPFFFFVSSYLDEHVDGALLRRSKSTDSSSPFQDLSIDEQVRELLDECARSLSQAKETSCVSRSKTIAETIEFVENCYVGGSSELSLFDRYIVQFIEWKIGGATTPVVLEWWRDRLQSSSAARSILCIHVIARVQTKAVMQISSIATLARRFPTRDVFDGVVSATTPSNGFDDLLCLFEDSVVDGAGSDFSFIVSTAMELKILGGTNIDAGHIERRVRRISFLRLLDPTLHSTPLQDVAARLRSWKGSSISEFVALPIIAGTKSSYELLALKHFLSPAWTQVTDEFVEEDLAFFLEWMHRSSSVDSRGHVDVDSIVRFICDYASNARIGNQLILQVNAALTCSNLGVFSDDGRRSCLPIYIPNWLSERQQSLDHAEIRPPFAVFFRDFTHCFGECPLAEAVFRAWLTSFCSDAEGISSEGVYLSLAREIDIESNVTRAHNTPESRTTGTAWSSIELSARAVCFVLKAAHEAACLGSIQVFNGVYSEDAHAFFCHLMTGRPVWQRFFMNSILRFRGEGALFNALQTRGNLQGLDWCQQWTIGLPSANDHAILQLQAAENDFAETTAQEEEKARQHLLCPHCRQPFIVDQRNCGMFRCGSDAHLLGGRPQVGGAVVGEGHGCGREFGLSTALRYTVDRALLDEKRRHVEDHRKHVEACKDASGLLTDAQQMFIPVFQIRIEPCSSESLLPAHYLLLAMESESDEKLRDLLALLVGASQLADRLRCLPDLIEVRAGFHFRICFNLTFCSFICGCTIHFGSC